MPDDWLTAATERLDALANSEHLPDGTFTLATTWIDDRRRRHELTRTRPTLGAPFGPPVHNILEDTAP